VIAWSIAGSSSAFASAPAEKEAVIHSRRARVEIQTVEISSGGTGTPIVMLHPWGASLRIWHAIAPKLAAERRVILLDLPAHGRSSHPPGRYPPKRLAGAVLDVMDRLGVPRAIVAGNSLGGATAIAVAELAPDRVAGLVLIGAPGGQPIPEPIRRIVRSFTSPMHLSSVSYGAIRFSWRFTAGGEPEIANPVIDDILKIRGAPDWAQRSIALSSALEEVAGYEPKLEQILIRTLVVHGDDDLVVPLSSSEALSKRLPNAELKVLEDCGHCPEMDCPAELEASIDAFARGL
jgi:pimeloyl-ACP methyl ester carboxylesterase